MGPTKLLGGGYELIAVHVDAGVSGAKTSNRPALQTALAEATTAKSTLVTYSLSRLARSTRDAIAISERLTRAGAGMVSVSEHVETTTAAGKMVFRMLAVLAEFERDIISERTKAAMQHKRARCEYTGGEAPDDPRGHSCLVLGFANPRPIHAVCAVTDNPAGSSSDYRV